MSESITSEAVLAVGAHPDDIEFLCAGTLALLKQRGYRIAMATMTAGGAGSVTLNLTETANIRRQEARESASILDADYFCLEFTDFGIVFGENAVRRVTALIREVQPQVILTHAPHDYMADHEETSRIVRQACFAAPVPNFDTAGLPGSAEPTRGIPYLYYADPIEGTDIYGRPVETSLIVDITETMETKEEMLARHESQREWLRSHHGIDQYVEQMRLWSASRGEQIGCAFGEGFRQHLGHAYPHDNLLRTILGSIVHETEL